jgi:putative membrane protein
VPATWGTAVWEAAVAHRHDAVPPAPTLGRVLTDWSADLPVLVALGLAAGLYLWGVRRLRARGDRWPPGRTLAWLGGLAVVAAALLSGLGDYGDVLFSLHAVQHMLLAMVAPLPLALGAPVTLALRTLPPRPRRALLRVLHSRVTRVLTFPLVVFAVFVVSLFALYFTDLFGWSLRNEAVHYAVHAHFLLSGCLFFWPLVGLDPLPGRLPYWGRLLAVFVTLPVHAIVGLTILSTTEVYAAEYYRGLDRDWGTSLLADQHAGGALMWGGGELVGILLIFVLYVQWARSEERAAIRIDRDLDRREAAGRAGLASADAPAEDERLLEEERAYNAWLADLARVGPGRAGRFHRPDQR